MSEEKKARRTPQQVAADKLNAANKKLVALQRRHDDTAKQLEDIARDLKKQDELVEYLAVNPLLS